MARVPYKRICKTLKRKLKRTRRFIKRLKVFSRRNEKTDQVSFYVRPKLLDSNKLLCVSSKLRKIKNYPETMDGSSLVEKNIFPIRNPYYKSFRKEITFISKVIANTGEIKSKQDVRNTLKFTSAFKGVLRHVLDMTEVTNLNNYLYGLYSLFR